MKYFPLLAFLILAVSTAHAETASGHVTNLGCHDVDYECWVNLETYGASAYCNHANQIRWSTDTPWGSRWYAILLAAYLSGKNVSLLIRDDVCSNQGYPTFLYGSTSD